MTHAELQAELARRGTYHGAIDGKFGPASQAALIAALAAGPDTPLCQQDITRAAQSLAVPESAIRAVWTVEANGAGFQSGLAKILPEPHRFSKNTHGLYDESHPDLSWAIWEPGHYPALQSERYVQLAKMVALDVDAGLKSCSYGAFQILGENYAACGYSTVWDMVIDLSLTEGDQLSAFVAFIRSRRLDGFLRTGDWAGFALRFNGTAFAKNHYDTRLAAAAAQRDLA